MEHHYEVGIAVVNRAWPSPGRQLWTVSRRSEPVIHNCRYVDDVKVEQEAARPAVSAVQ